MFWVGLATLIMLISGTGDDTRAFRQRLDQMSKALTELVHEPSRKNAALETLKQTETALTEHRARLNDAGKCLESADRNYTANATDYDTCVAQLDAGWDVATEQLLRANKRFHSILTTTEWRAVHNKVGHKR